MTAPQKEPAGSEREAFEAWFSETHHNRLCRNMPDKSYNDPAAHAMWEAWQARASQPSGAAGGEVDAQIKRARAIVSRLCDNGLLSMSIPVRQEDEDMVLCAVIDRASLASPSSGGWQSIESAPKDGTMFLCWVGAERWSAMDGGGSGCAHDVSQIDFCWWRRVHESPDGGYFDNASGQIGDSQGVTHWMPLPPAPKSGDKSHE